MFCYLFLTKYHILQCLSDRVCFFSDKSLQVVCRLFLVSHDWSTLLLSVSISPVPHTASNDHLYSLFVTEYNAALRYYKACIGPTETPCKLAPLAINEKVLPRFVSWAPRWLQPFFFLRHCCLMKPTKNDCWLPLENPLFLGLSRFEKHWRVDPRPDVTRDSCKRHRVNGLKAIHR